MSTAPIALDASLWDEPTTGIGLYTRCLSDALTAEGVSVEHFGARHSGAHPRGPLGSTAYTVTRLPAQLAASRARIFHALGNFNLPLTRSPGKAYVLTVHDLIPLLLRETASTAFRWQFRIWMGHSVKVADRIICVSETTRDDLEAAFPDARGKTTVVHHGVDHVDPGALSEDEERFVRALGLPETFALYAGSLDVRKNVDLVLDACERLHDRGKRITLVLVGQSWFGSSRVEARISWLRDRGLDLRSLGYQSSAIFYSLMQRASLFVFPSRYEGFGLPPLEAMRLGVPTLVSTAGALPEVCGEAAIRVAPDDPEAVAAALVRMLGSVQERREWGERGMAWAKRYTWARCARETAAVYASLG